MPQARRSNAVGCGVRKEGRHQRIGKGGVIKNIVKVRPELHFNRSLIEVILLMAKSRSR